MSREKIDRTGEENYNNEGTLMRIIEYRNNSDILIEFQDEYKYKKSTTYNNFKKGKIKNPYDKTIFDVGYLGKGIYDKKDYPHIYDKWNNMMSRCYNPYYLNKYPTYIDCYVCSEWHSFQNFAQWYEENYYEIKDEKMCLDKDILIKGNKIYSPENCVFVPERINNLFVKRNKLRGDCPLGMSWDKKYDKFRARCKILDEENKDKLICLGSYNTIDEAFLAYKNFKENHIKEVADEYKDLIPQKLYDALYKYEVEIND